MEYETDCPCGKTIVVRAADAGATVRCGCGRQVDVPALSRLRRFDPPPLPPGPPSLDYAYLRVPGVITAAIGIGAGMLTGCVVGPEGGLVYLSGIMLAYAAQVVGVALVCVSKRFPVFMCVLFAPFGCFGFLPALFIPERLPPSHPPR